MKKLVSILAVFGALAASSVSYGVVQINWSGPSGGITDEGGALAPSGWVTQLIFTPSGTISAPTAGDPFAMSGDNVLLQTQTLSPIPIDGRLIGAQSPYNEDNSLENGFVFARVFNVTSQPASPDLATLRYGDSVTFGNPNNMVNGGLMITTNDPNTINQVAPSLMVNQQVIPEPSTYALLAFGGLVMLWRNRRQANKAE